MLRWRGTRTSCNQIQNPIAARILILVPPPTDKNIDKRQHIPLPPTLLAALPDTLTIPPTASRVNDLGQLAPLDTPPLIPNVWDLDSFSGAGSGSGSGWRSDSSSMSRNGWATSPWHISRPGRILLNLVLTRWYEVHN